MNNKLDCEDCRKFFSSKDKLDYDCVFQNGICSECLFKRAEMMSQFDFRESTIEEWNRIILELLEAIKWTQK